MKKLFIKAFKKSLGFLYWFMKRGAQKPNKVLFMSRQFNKPSLDFLEIERKLREKSPDIEIEMLCRKMRGGLADNFLYFFHILKQMRALASSAVCVIDTYIIPVCVLKHRESLRIIQIWHAVGTVKKFGYQTLGKPGGRDKDTAYAMEMHRGYDMAVSGSEAMRGAFAQAFHMDTDCIMIAWPPKLDYLKKNEDAIKESLLEKYQFPPDKKVILYAPTYRRKNDYSPSDLINQIDFNRYTLIVKGHPAKDMNMNDGRAYQCRSVSASELIAISDIVITDYSAISIEAAALGRAVYLYVYDYEEYCQSVGLNVDIYAELPGCVFQRADELAAALEQDYPREAARAFAEKYAPEEGANGADRICSAVLNAMSC